MKISIVQGVKAIAKSGFLLRKRLPFKKLKEQLL